VTRKLTASSMSTARSCLRRYHFAYELGVRPLETAAPLRFGTLFHGLLEWRLRPTADGSTDPVEADEYDRARARALFAGYCARWESDAEDYEVIAVEVPFEAKLRAPSGRRSPRWQIGGVLDGILRERRTGRVLLLEHKTTSEDIRPGTDYWTRLRLDAQVSLYYQGAAALGYHVDACLYDVIAKPGLKPLRATPPEARKYTKEGRLYANQRERDETPEEYEARLVAAIAAEPEAYYQRAEVVRLEAELLEAHRDTWDMSRLLTLGHRPRNPRACLEWGRSCSYLPVCSGAASLDDETRYRRLDNPHPEIGDTE
jgi:hypothetical protein